MLSFIKKLFGATPVAEVAPYKVEPVKAAVEVPVVVAEQVAVTTVTEAPAPVKAKKTPAAKKPRAPKKTK